MIARCLFVVFISLYFSLQTFAQAPYLVILGTAQDGGYPQAGCKKSCCEKVWKQPELKRYVSCLALVQPQTNSAWLLDATPDFREQWTLLKQQTNDSIKPAGILLTHAHIGHYAGLMQLGREVMGAKEVKVYAMPRMKQFLETNGPWSQLVTLKNIVIQPIQAQTAFSLFEGATVTPYPVPHRDEYSETVGFMLNVADKQVLYLPDIDKWEKWDMPVLQLVAKTDMAFIDATFYSENELPGRSMKEVPHPLVTESIKLFESVKQRIYFIHLNHTNPLLDMQSDFTKSLLKQGFHIAEQGKIIPLK